MKEVNEWFRKAEKDLKAAKINLKQGLFDVSAFLSHQAAEKALKALYILRFKRLWKIHDLKELGNKVGTPANLIKICDSLNPHYIETRYPLEIEYDKEKAKVAINNAKKVIEWVRKKIEK